MTNYDSMATLHAYTLKSITQGLVCIQFNNSIFHLSVGYLRRFIENELRLKYVMQALAENGFRAFYVARTIAQDTKLILFASFVHSKNQSK